MSDFQNNIEILSTQIDSAVKQGRKYRLYLILFLYASCFLGKGRHHNGDFSDFIQGLLAYWGFMTVFSLIILVTKIEFFIPKKLKNDINNKYKLRVLSSYLLEHTNSYHINPIKKIEKSIIKNSKLFEFNEFRGDNLIEFYINEKKVILSRVFLLNGLRKEFYGVLVKIENLEISKDKLENIFSEYKNIKFSTSTTDSYIAIPYKEKFLSLKYTMKSDKLDSLMKDVELIGKIIELLKDTSVNRESS